MFDQYRVLQPNVNVWDIYTTNDYCITLWGARDQCYSRGVDTSIDSLFSNCPQRVCMIKVALYTAQGVSLLLLICFFITLGLLCRHFHFLLVDVANILNVFSLLGILMLIALVVFNYTVNLSGGGDKSVTSNPCVQLQNYTGPDSTSNDTMTLGLGFISTCIAFVCTALNCLNLYVFSSIKQAQHVNSL